MRELLPAEASVANPVDMLGSATAASYAQALPVVLDDPQVDAVLVLFVPAVSATAEEVAIAVDARGPCGRVREAGARRRDDLGRSPAGAARRLGRRRRSRIPSRRRARSAASPSAPSGCGGRSAPCPRSSGSTAPPPRASSSARSRARRTRGSIRPRRASCSPPTACRWCRSGSPHDADEAARAAAELGFPAVVKSAAAGAHKTETGGVALDLEDEAAVRAAAERIGFPVIVQPMLRGGTELLAGLVQDPVFGPLVAFGPGGVFAELIGDASLRIAPLTDFDAEELVTAGKAGRLVRGFRGADPADTAALVDLVHRLAALGDDLPAVAELDLNPVLGFPDRAVAVDARVRISRPGSSGARRAGSGSRSFPQRARRPPGCRHEARRRRFERQQPKEE